MLKKKKKKIVFLTCTFPIVDKLNNLFSFIRIAKFKSLSPRGCKL